MSKKIKLRDDELSLCELVGRNRSLIARASNIKDAKVGKQDGAKADEMGFMAEYAFAKIFNVFPDVGFFPRSGSADGVLRGFNYDVKATSYKSGKLLCTKKDNPDIDMYVLAIVNPPEVDIVGYAMKEDLRKKENLKNLGHGEGYCLTQDRLTKFK